MDKINLRGSNNYIFYDLENKIIGRKLTKSNLLENGSDNSLYFGSGNNNIDAILSKVCGTDDLKKIVGTKYKLKVGDIFVEFVFNINACGQRQFKMLNDSSRKRGRLYRTFDYYRTYNKLELSKNDIVFLLDLKKSELLIMQNDDLLVKYTEFEKTVKELIENAKKEGVKTEDMDAFISTQIKVRNSEVQKKFRNDLLKEFNHKCAICNVDKKELLIASHILPYHKCPTVKEMIDNNNGLLLCVMHDALFDKNYITFDKKGKIIISKEIDKKMHEVLNVNSDIILNSKFLTDMRIKYLATHKVK